MRPKTALPLVLVAAVVALGLLTANWIQTKLLAPDGPAWFDPEKPFREAQLGKLREILDSAPETIEFELGGRRLAVTDRRAVREFLEILVNGQDVGRHHSHPEAETGFSFSGRPEIYRLGRDSARAQEYWLQLRRRGASGPYYQTIVLFRSERMAAWLEENQVAGRGAERK